MVHPAGVPDALRAGVAILGAVLSPARFRFRLAAEARGSGGGFTAGRFTRDRQDLELAGTDLGADLPGRSPVRVQSDTWSRFGWY
jgi:hypothetical protein